VLEALQTAGIVRPVLVLGLPDRFVEHGDPARLMAGLDLDAAGIARSIERRFGTAPAPLAAPETAGKSAG